jgi:hypothetical protein
MTKWWWLDTRAHPSVTQPVFDGGSGEECEEELMLRGSAEEALAVTAPRADVVAAFGIDRSAARHVVKVGRAIWRRIVCG